jgi:hypothetical protein
LRPEDSGQEKAYLRLVSAWAPEMSEFKKLAMMLYY